MNFKKKRLSTIIVVCIYMFLAGCEFGVIYPTAWDYLQSYGATHEYWLGFVLSGYCFAAAIGGIIGGRLADMFVSKTKHIVFTSIIIMAIGNIQYCIGYSIWNILFSRMVCGLGTSAAAALLGEICRATEFKERTFILAICNAARQFGILIGPAFQIMFTKFYFKIGPLQFTPLNAPGFLMFFLCLFYAILVYFLFYNLTVEFNLLDRHSREKFFKELHLQNKKNKNRNGKNGKFYGTFKNGENEENEFSFFSNASTVSISEQKENSFENNSENKNIQQSTLYDEIFTDDFVVIISMIFTMYFCGVGLETSIPIIMEDFFNLGEFENSLVFMTTALLAFVSFLLVAYLSKFMRDTTLTIIGWGFVLSSNIWLISFVHTFQEENTNRVAYFIIGVSILFIGFPIITAANTGLTAKSLSEENQGIGQGINRMATFVALVLGPNWAGSAVKRPYIFIGVFIALILLQLIMFAFSFKRLRIIEKNQPNRKMSILI